MSFRRTVIGGAPGQGGCSWFERRALAGRQPRREIGHGLCQELLIGVSLAALLDELGVQRFALGRALGPLRRGLLAEGPHEFGDHVVRGVPGVPAEHGRGREGAEIGKRRNVGHRQPLSQKRERAKKEPSPRPEDRDEGSVRYLTARLRPIPLTDDADISSGGRPRSRKLFGRPTSRFRAEFVNTSPGESGVTEPFSRRNVIH